VLRYAQASPLQCAAIADSCLAMGAATCRAAAAAINKAIDDNQLGPKAAGGKVLISYSAFSSTVVCNSLHLYRYR
jgi:hypothetical protein